MEWGTVPAYDIWKGAESMWMVDTVTEGAVEWRELCGGTTEKGGRVDSVGKV